MKEKPSFSKGQKLKYAKWKYRFPYLNILSEFRLCLSFIWSSCEFNRVATEIEEKMIVSLRVMYYAKCTLKYFGCLGFRILVGN